MHHTNQLSMSSGREGCCRLHMSPTYQKIFVVSRAMTPIARLISDARASRSRTIKKVCVFVLNITRVIFSHIRTSIRGCRASFNENPSPRATQRGHTSPSHTWRNVDGGHPCERSIKPAPDHTPPPFFHAQVETRLNPREKNIRSLYIGNTTETARMNVLFG